MTMKLTVMEVSVLPYSDGSGNTFTLKLNEEGAVSINQAGHIVIFTAEQWRIIKRATEALFTTANQIGIYAEKDEPRP